MGAHGPLFATEGTGEQFCSERSVGFLHHKQRQCRATRRSPSQPQPLSAVMQFVHCFTKNWLLFGICAFVILWSLAFRH